MSNPAGGPTLTLERLSAAVGGTERVDLSWVAGPLHCPTALPISKDSRRIVRRIFASEPAALVARASSASGGAGPAPTDATAAETPPAPTPPQHVDARVWACLGSGTMQI